MKQLYIIEYDNAHWCGGTLHCVAWANNENDAETAADLHMDECQRELFSDEYAQEPELEEEPSYIVNSVELLKGSKVEPYYKDPVQRANFYPCVNPEDAV